MLRKYSIIFLLSISLFIGCNRQPNIEKSTISSEESEENQSKKIVGAWRGDKNSDWKDKSFEFFDDGRLVYTMETGQPWSGRYVILREGQLRADLWDILGMNFPTIWDFFVEGDTLYLDFFRNSNPIAFRKFIPGTSELLDQINEDFDEQSSETLSDDPNFLFYDSGCEIRINPFAVFLSQSETPGMQNVDVAYASSFNVPGTTEKIMPSKINPCFKAHYQGTAGTDIPIWVNLETKEGFLYPVKDEYDTGIPVPEFAVPSGLNIFSVDYSGGGVNGYNTNLLTFETAENLSYKTIIINDWSTGAIIKTFDLDDLPVFTYNTEQFEIWTISETASSYLLSNNTSGLFPGNLQSEIKKIPISISSDEIELKISNISFNDDEIGFPSIRVSLIFKNLSLGYKQDINNIYITAIDNKGIITRSYNTGEFFGHAQFAKIRSDCPQDGLLGANQSCYADMDVRVFTQSDKYYLILYYHEDNDNGSIEYEIIDLEVGNTNSQVNGDQNINQDDMSITNSCIGAPPTNMEIGMKARVTYRDNTPLALRSEPLISKSTFIKDLREGTKFTVIDGPECRSGYLWWNIETKEGAVGWSAEGDEKDYFMEPYDW